MNKRSFVYQELNDGEICAVMRSVFPWESVVEYCLLAGGLFTTTYRVVTSGHDVVLRMGPVRRELLLPYEHNLMAAECETDRLCHSRGVPASRVICVDVSRTVIDRDFMVVERIDSLPLNDPSFSEETRRKLHFDCGGLMRKMHSIQGQRFGRMADIVAGKGYDTWFGALEGEFANIFRTACDCHIFSEELEARTFEYLQARKDILDRITVPRLAHCDLWDGNILARQEHGQAQVCAIIDGDRAIFGDVDLDISRIWRHNPDFLAGYGEIETDFTDEEIQEKRNVYSIMLNLNDAYVWIIEYDNQQAYEHTRDAAMKILGMI